MSWIIASVPLWILGVACFFQGIWWWQSAMFDEKVKRDVRTELAGGGAVMLAISTILLMLAAKVAS